MENGTFTVSFLKEGLLKACMLINVFTVVLTVVTVPRMAG